MACGLWGLTLHELTLRGRYQQYPVINHQPSRVFAGPGAGPLGVEPTCIVKLRAVDTPRCCIMHDRCARSTTKSGFPMAFSEPVGSGCAQRKGRPPVAPYSSVDDNLARLPFAAYYVMNIGIGSSINR
jgi:hypothetical protein